MTCFAKIILFINYTILKIITYSNMMSIFHFVNKQAIYYRLGIISLSHTPVHVPDSLVVNVHVDELSSTRT